MSRQILQVNTDIIGPSVGLGPITLEQVLVSMKINDRVSPLEKNLNPPFFGTDQGLINKL